jgi:hypothetical protein
MSWVPGKLWILVKPGMGSSSTNESLAVSGGYVLTIFFLWAIQDWQWILVRCLEFPWVKMGQN